MEPLPLLTAGERYRTAPIRECLILQEVLLEDLLEGPVGDTVITSAQISDPYVLISLRWVEKCGGCEGRECATGGWEVWGGEGRECATGGCVSRPQGHHHHVIAYFESVR